MLDLAEERITTVGHHSLNIALTEISLTSLDSPAQELSIHIQPGSATRILGTSIAITDPRSSTKLHKPVLNKHTLKKELQDRP